MKRVIQHFSIDMVVVFWKKKVVRPFYYWGLFEQITLEKFVGQLHRFILGF